MPAIEVRGLTKSYKEVQAVRGLDLEVSEGDIFALLGPNGAGKTTTVEILEGFRDRDSGDVRVLGHDPASGARELKSRIGIVLQTTGVERFLTVEEVIAMYAGYYPAPMEVGEIIGLVGLEDKRNEKVYKLSGGQMRRLDVAVGLAGDPDLLFLDEPTTGFDPSARRAAWDMVDGLKSLGKTVFLTTHYMDEAQYLADRVAIIVAGRIIAEGPPSELGGSGSRSTFINFETDPDTSVPSHLEAVAGPSGESVIETDDPVRRLHALTSWALDEGVELRRLRVSRATLEDTYLRLTQEETE